jgi:hypothetical protein
MLTAQRSHIMIDIETLGVAPNSVIVQIAAAEFDLWADTLTLDNTFSINVDPASGKEIGLVTDQGTIDFWKKQPEETIKSVFSNAVPIKTALSELSRWMGTISTSPVIWANGAGFDPVLLGVAYDLCGMKPPWGFRDIRDTRTIYDIVGVKDHRTFMPEGGLFHNALADVYMQAAAVNYCINRIAVFEENNG